MLYDVITVGGGLAGATLAKNLAEHGYRVLVLERETHFRDRVRGEQMHPWGVAEARALGIYDNLATTWGHQTRWWLTYQGTTLVEHRDLAATTPHGVGSFNCSHPAMQEAVLHLAVEAGAEVRRGITVEGVACNMIGRINRVSAYRHPILACRSAAVQVAIDWRLHAHHNAWLLVSPKRGLFF